MAPLGFPDIGPTAETILDGCSTAFFASNYYMISRFLFVCAALLLASCQSVQPLSSVGPGGKTRIGQLRYATVSGTVVGDVVLDSLPNGDLDLEFSKGGLPVLQIQIRGETMRATGLLARGGWSGSALHPIGPLRAWAQLKQIVPHFETGKRAEKTGIWSANFRREKNSLTSADVKFSTGEAMSFSFAP
jgi:hypothetical protein